MVIKNLSSRTFAKNKVYLTLEIFHEMLNKSVKFEYVKEKCGYQNN